ncbi:MAG: 7TM domain-containing protein [Actinomycetota bacterium]
MITIHEPTDRFGVDQLHDPTDGHGLHRPPSFADRRAAATPLFITAAASVATVLLHTADPTSPVATPPPLAVLPVAVAVAVALGLIVGVRSLGTFTPALVATAVVTGDAVETMTIMLGMLALGLLGERALRTVMLPRLGRLGVLVAAGCGALSVAGTEDHLSTASVAGLPVVAGMMAVERLWQTLDADGATESVRLVGGTATTIAAAAVVTSAPRVHELAITSPGLLAVVSAGLILAAGSYQGLRLVELVRFCRPSVAGAAS